MAALPTTSAFAAALPEGGPRRVALVGRPNVGKSSLLNKVAGAERVVVDHVAGTTRDPVDELVELRGKPWWFVDTAGIRRRVHQTSGADFYASLRTQAAIEKAEVAVVLVDASVKMTEQDTRVISQVVDAGRALVIAYNKWDLMDEDRRPFLEREIEQDLVQVQWAPRVNISARTGWHADRLVPALERSLASWDTRVPTGRLNAFLGELVAAHPHPLRGGKQPRILFATQAVDPAAAVRHLRHRVPRGRLPPVHRAPPARDVRLRGHPDRDLGPGAGEAPAVSRAASDHQAADDGAHVERPGPCCAGGCRAIPRPRRT